MEYNHVIADSIAVKCTQIPLCPTAAILGHPIAPGESDSTTGPFGSGVVVPLGSDLRTVQDPLPSGLGPMHMGVSKHAPSKRAEGRCANRYVISYLLKNRRVTHQTLAYPRFVKHKNIETGVLFTISQSEFRLV
jgi:hypothetical protein